MDKATAFDRETMRQGALAGIAALRKIGTISEALNTSDNTLEQCWNATKSIVDLAVRESGVTSAYTAGFLAALAEYVEFSILTGVPNLEEDKWMPDSAMTEGELAEHRGQMKAEFVT